MRNKTKENPFVYFFIFGKKKIISKKIDAFIERGYEEKKLIKNIDNKKRKEYVRNVSESTYN